MTIEAVTPATKIIGIAGTGFTWSAAMVTILNLLVGGALVALVNAWPKLKKIATERADSLDDERRNDMGAMRTEMAELRSEVKEAVKQAQVAQNKLSSAVAAISLLSAEVRRLSPDGSDNSVLAQVRELLAAATSGDFGFAAGIEKITRAASRPTKP